MKLNQTEIMTTSAITPANRRRTAVRTFSYVLNFVGVIAGAAVALAALIGWGSPIGFFSGLAGGFFGLDGVRQSW